MRKTLVSFYIAILIINFSDLSFGQAILISPDEYNGALSELYLYRQPSARSESMGRIGVANSNGDFGSFYNPALTSLSQGITFNSSFSSPYYRSHSFPTNYVDSSKFNYFGLAYTNSKIGSFSFSRYNWNYGPEVAITDEIGNELGKGSFTKSIYTLNYSRELFKDLFAGLNLNLSQYHFPGYSSKDPISIDIGILKKFNFKNKEKSKITNSIQLGFAAMNITKSTIEYLIPEDKDALPVTIRVGANYIFKLKGKGLIPNGELFEASTNLEFQSVINEGYDKILKFGEEIIISEILAIRFGYFTQKLNVRNSPQYNADSQNQFTYGAGLNIPLSRLMKLKNSLNVKVDYVNLQPPTFSNYIKDWDNFSTIGLSLNWNPGF